MSGDLKFTFDVASHIELEHIPLLAELFAALGEKVRSFVPGDQIDARYSFAERRWVIRRQRPAIMEEV